MKLAAFRSARTVLIVSAVIALGGISGCASVPSGASDTNRAVSTGIERLKEQHEKTIGAFADLARQSVQNTWDNDILGDTITKVVGDSRSLTRDEAMRVAGIASNVRDRLLDEINDNEQKLLAAVKREYNLVKNINNVVTDYLASAEELASSREEVEQAALGVAELFGDEEKASFERILSIATDPNAASRSVSPQ